MLTSGPSGIPWLRAVLEIERNDFPNLRRSDIESNEIRLKTVSKIISAIDFLIIAIFAAIMELITMVQHRNCKFGLSPSSKPRVRENRHTIRRTVDTESRKTWSSIAQTITFLSITVRYPVTAGNFSIGQGGGYIKVSGKTPWHGKNPLTHRKAVDWMSFTIFINFLSKSHVFGQINAQSECSFINSSVSSHSVNAAGQQGTGAQRFSHQ